MVVPTATMRRLADLALLIALAAASRRFRRTRGGVYGLRLFGVDGWNVPRPTWRVISVVSIPRACDLRARISGVKCRPAVGAATDPRALRRRSGSDPDRRDVCAGDVGRERNVADALEAGERNLGRERSGWAFTEIPRERTSASSSEWESESPGAEPCGRRVRGRRIIFSPIPIFRPGRTRHSQFVGMLGELAGQEDLDSSAEKVADGGIMRAEGLGTLSTSVSVEAGWKDPVLLRTKRSSGRRRLGSRETVVFPGSIWCLRRLTRIRAMKMK